MKRSLHWYIKSLRILTNTKSVVASLFIRAHSIITSQDNLTKENAKINQVLKEMGYQEIIISKIFKKIANNHRLSQSQKQTQATDNQEEEEIRISINLPYVKVLVKNYDI